MAYTKKDVEIYQGLPSVNVKVHGRWDWQELVAKVASDENADERFTVEFVEKVLEEDTNDQWFEFACESNLEMIQQDAETIFGPRVETWREGRSGGHLVVHGLED